MKVLPLTLKAQWFEMIASGEKREEYREIKEYWNKRLNNQSFDAIKFTNGYGNHRPWLLVKCKGHSTGLGIESWGAKQGEKYHILHLGEILDRSPVGRLYLMAQRKCWHYTLPEGWEEVAWERFDYVECGVFEKPAEDLTPADRELIKWHGEEPEGWIPPAPEVLAEDDPGPRPTLEGVESVNRPAPLAFHKYKLAPVAALGENGE